MFSFSFAVGVMGLLQAWLYVAEMAEWLDTCAVSKVRPPISLSYSHCSQQALKQT